MRGVSCLAALLWLCAVAAQCALSHAAGDEPTGDADGIDAFDDEHDDELALDQEESRNLRPRAYSTGAYNALPSGFRPTPSLAELAGYQRQQHQQHQQQQQQQQHEPAQHYAPAEQPQPHARQPLRKAQQARLQAQAEEASQEEEREEPDRLALLLQQSRFDCVGKQTGYYADEELACEVFHYCQDSVKHSWICPDGFTFHQVHLICMPPTHDNICQKSAKYHFVNEYLYRPINEEEVQRKPNVSLKYSERYYPAEVYHDDRYDDDDDADEEAPRTAAPSPAPARHAPAPAPARLQAPAPAQVFRSPEEVNIPLLQRRPQHRPYDFDF